MSEFKYQEPFPLSADTTEYRLLTKDYVKVVECDGRKVLKVDPKGLELLSKEAFADVSFYLRAAHLQKLSDILKDPEATDNDKFVAYTMLINQVVSAQGELPTCQDTGTAIVIGKKGENVYTGADDAEMLSKGVYETYRDRNLRYSQVVPFSMTEEKNSGTNLPAQIDLYATPGDEYKFLFITKGGGSANKTFLYQQTKALLTEENLTNFIKSHIMDLGTAACPPYHLAIVIGGTSAEANLSTVKKASAGYLDHLPTSGNEGGHAFRDLEWEQKVLKICQESGVGAQFGGKYLCTTCASFVSRAMRRPARSVSACCSADRNIKAKNYRRRYFPRTTLRKSCPLPAQGSPNMQPAVELDLDEGMDKVRETLSKYPVKTRFNVKGTLVVARDIAHARIKQMIDEGKPMPEYFKKHPIYYAGPAKTPQGMASGSFGPTTAGRMDPYVDLFQSLGGSLVMVAKGNRSQAVTDACKKHGGFYLGSIGGPAAVLAKDSIKSVEVVDFPELGMEAVRKIYVENFPAFLLVDDKGNDFFAAFKNK